MTATLVQSQAILKRKYAGGALPKNMYKKAPFIASMTHATDFNGDTYTVALQTENVQAVSTDFQTALGVSTTSQGQYFRFLLPRTNEFSLARIQGEALEATKGNDGAMVDLWDNETNGASGSLLMSSEVYAFGDGSGVLGQAASGLTTATITLGNAYDITKFALTMKVQAVSDATLSPTIRSGSAIITGIDRQLGTLTVSGNWNDPGNIPGITANDYLVRAGDASVAGTPKVISGTKAYIAGGPTPPVLFGLTRTTDTVRLAGQRYSAAGNPMEDSLIQAEALRNLQYTEGSLVAWCNTVDLGTLKKSLGGKVEYTKVEMNSKIAGVSFKGIEFEGDNGPIKLMGSPFVSSGDVHMLYMDSFGIKSLGPAPKLADHDGNNFLRLASDDAYECRFVSRQQMSCNNPAASIIITGWGQ